MVYFDPREKFFQYFFINYSVAVKKKNYQNEIKILQTFLKGLSG